MESAAEVVPAAEVDLALRTEVATGRMLYDRESQETMTREFLRAQGFHFGADAERAKARL